MSTVARLTAAESRSKRQGSSAIVVRLAEVLLVQMIRSYMDLLPQNTGFLAALNDHAIAAALEQMHNQPQLPWDVQQLASIAGMSRSVFANRFSTQVGVGPIQYLTNWRLQKAAEFLVAGQKSTAQIAEKVGYLSEWAFSKAFKRLYGVGPGAYRRKCQHCDRNILKR